MAVVVGASRAPRLSKFEESGFRTVVWVCVVGSLSVWDVADSSADCAEGNSSVVV